jgi:putative alpha-1,2-mannosidase
MGSFQFLSMLGLFPNPGQNIYLIIPPFFEAVSVSNPLTNKTATIRNINFDPSYQNIFVQNATLNGQPYTRSWIGHEFFTEGWTLELTLGAQESSWGTGDDDLPPSVSKGSTAGMRAL